MNLLSTVFGFFRKRKQETLVARKCYAYVDPAIVEMLKSDSMPFTPPVSGEVNFLIIQFMEGEPFALQACVNEAIRLIREQHAHIDSVCGSLLFATFDAPSFKVDSLVQRRETVAKMLIERLGTRVRIVHGNCDGVTGELGNRSYGRFGTSLRRFNTVLEQLFTLSPGESREFKNDSL